MPLSAALNPLQSLIKLALISDVGGSPNMLAQSISGAIAAIAPMGLFPAGMAMIPLVPAGVTGAQSLMQTSFISDVGGSPDVLSNIIGGAIVAVCPMVPPIGLTALQSLLKIAFQMDMGGTPDAVAQSIAGAIVTYYSMGMVV